MELTDVDKSFLKDQPFLKGLSSEQFRIVTDDAWLMNLTSDQALFKKGEPARSFFLILEGKFGIISSDDVRGSKKIQTVGPGDVVGWSWLIPPHRWRFSAITLEPSCVLALNGERLRQHCEEDPALGYEITKRMIAVLASRLESAIVRPPADIRGSTP